MRNEIYSVGNRIRKGTKNNFLKLSLSLLFMIFPLLGDNLNLSTISAGNKSAGIEHQFEQDTSKKKKVYFNNSFKFNYSFNDFNNPDFKNFKLEDSSRLMFHKLNGFTWDNFLNFNKNQEFFSGRASSLMNYLNQFDTFFLLDTSINGSFAGKKTDFTEITNYELAPNVPASENLRTTGSDKNMQIAGDFFPGGRASIKNIFTTLRLGVEAGLFKTIKEKNTDLTTSWEVGTNNFETGDLINTPTETLTKLLGFKGGLIFDYKNNKFDLVMGRNFYYNNSDSSADIILTDTFGVSTNYTNTSKTSHKLKSDLITFEMQFNKFLKFFNASFLRSYTVPSLDLPISEKGTIVYELNGTGGLIPNKLVTERSVESKYMNFGLGILIKNLFATGFFEKTKQFSEIKPVYGLDSAGTHIDPESIWNINNFSYDHNGDRKISHQLEDIISFGISLDLLPKGSSGVFLDNHFTESRNKIKRKRNESIEAANVLFYFLPYTPYSMANLDFNFTKGKTENNLLRSDLLSIGFGISYDIAGNFNLSFGFNNANTDYSRLDDVTLTNIIKNNVKSFDIGARYYVNANGWDATSLLLNFHIDNITDSYYDGHDEKKRDFSFNVALQTDFGSIPNIAERKLRTKKERRLRKFIFNGLMINLINNDKSLGFGEKRDDQKLKELLKLVNGSALFDYGSDFKYDMYGVDGISKFNEKFEELVPSMSSVFQNEIDQDYKFLMYSMGCFQYFKDHKLIVLPDVINYGDKKKLGLLFGTFAGDENYILNIGNKAITNNIIGVYLVKNDFGIKGQTAMYTSTGGLIINSDEIENIIDTYYNQAEEIKLEKINRSISNYSLRTSEKLLNLGMFHIIKNKNKEDFKRWFNNLYDITLKAHEINHSFDRMNGLDYSSLSNAAKTEANSKLLEGLIKIKKENGEIKDLNYTYAAFVSLTSWLNEPLKEYQEAAKMIIPKIFNEFNRSVNGKYKNMNNFIIDVHKQKTDQTLLYNAFLNVYAKQNNLNPSDLRDNITISELK